MQETNRLSWKDGVYKFPPNYRFHAIQVTGTTGEVKFVMEPDMLISMINGHFQTSDDRGLKETGSTHYNVEVSTTEPGVPKFYAVIGNNGNTWTFSDGISGQWMDIKTFEEIKEDTDPCDAYPCDYLPNSDYQGKLLWISGVTGIGKSTVSLNLKNEYDYVLYEGDCFAAGFNPYVGSAPKATTPHGTRKLSGIPEERTLVCQRFQEESIKKSKMGCPVDADVSKQFYELMCDDISNERLKYGGNWVINHGLYTKLAREVVKQKLGSNLQLIVLEMSSEHQAKRFIKNNPNHSKISDEDIYKKMLEEKRSQIEISRRGYESVDKSEANVLEVAVTDEMTVQDISKRIIDLIF